MTKKVFSPGCALMIYKPELAKNVHALLNKNLGTMDELTICCHHDPQFVEATEVINICPGCDKRFANDYQNSTTVSLWEILAGNESFAFPDYHGKQMSIIDACPTRENEKVHDAIRTLLKKINIDLVEPKQTRTKSTCCGDSLYGTISTEKVKEQMKKRASEMPCEDVVVYCVSCINSVFIGGKKPYYLVDLLFSEQTIPKIFEPDEWHQAITEYIDAH